MQKRGVIPNFGSKNQGFGYWELILCLNTQGNRKVWVLRGKFLKKYPRSAVAVVSASNTRGARISRSECAKYPRGAD